MHEVSRQKNSHLIIRQQRGSLSELHATVGGFLYGSEIWKDIKGFKNYEISSYGRVRNFNRYKDINYKRRKILKLKADQEGYFFVNLHKGKYRKMGKISRLVAQHFIPNPKKLPIVNHLDNDRQNNYYKNLEWNTVAGNNKHMALQGRSTLGTKNPHSKLSEKEVLEIRKLINKFSIIELAKKYKVSYSSIHCIISRKKWKHI